MHDELACRGKNQKLALQWILPCWWSMSPMLVGVRHQQQYRCHGRHSETVGPREGCARGRNFTDVSELPSEHGVHRRKIVDRLVYVIRTSFKRWNFWKVLNLKNTHMVWIVWSIRKDRSNWNAALETKEYLSELKWKFDGSTFYSLQIWQVCSIIFWSSDSFQRREFQVECSPSLYRPLIKRKPFLIVTWGFLNAFNFAYLLYDEISNLMKSCETFARDIRSEFPVQVKVYQSVTQQNCTTTPSLDLQF